eukprot:UC4_evm1s892
MFGRFKRRVLPPKQPSPWENHLIYRGLRLDSVSQKESKTSLENHLAYEGLLLEDTTPRQSKNSRENHILSQGHPLGDIPQKEYKTSQVLGDTPNSESITSRENHTLSQGLPLDNSLKRQISSGGNGEVSGHPKRTRLEEMTKIRSSGSCVADFYTSYQRDASGYQPAMIEIEQPDETFKENGNKIPLNQAPESYTKVLEPDEASKKNVMPLNQAPENDSEPAMMEVEHIEESPNAIPMGPLNQKPENDSESAMMEVEHIDDQPSDTPMGSLNEAPKPNLQSDRITQVPHSSHQLPNDTPAMAEASLNESDMMMQVSHKQPYGILDKSPQHRQKHIPDYLSKIVKQFPKHFKDKVFSEEHDRIGPIRVTKDATLLLVAGCGMGKSTSIHHWLAKMLKQKPKLRVIMLSVRIIHAYALEADYKNMRCVSYKKFQPGNPRGMSQQNKVGPA